MERGNVMNNKEETENTKPLSILLVENSIIDAHLVKLVLKKYMSCMCNFKHVRSIKDAEIFLKQQNDIDIILLELNLPDSNNSADSYTRINVIQPETPVIILTSKDNHDLALKVVDSGAEDYVHKPSITTYPARLCDAIDFAVCRHKHFEEAKHEKEDALKAREELLQFVYGGYSVVKNRL